MNTCHDCDRVPSLCDCDRNPREMSPEEVKESLRLDGFDVDRMAKHAKALAEWLLKARKEGDAEPFKVEWVDR